MLANSHYGSVQPRVPDREHAKQEDFIAMGRRLQALCGIITVCPPARQVGNASILTKPKRRKMVKNKSAMSLAMILCNHLSVFLQFLGQSFRRKNKQEKQGSIRLPIVATLIGEKINYQGKLFLDLVFKLFHEIIQSCLVAYINCTESELFCQFLSQLPLNT